MRDNSAIGAPGGQPHGLECFAQAADLVELYKDGVRHSGLDTAAQEVDIRHKEVVTHKLAALAEAVGEQLPTIPVVFGAAVFDGDDGIAVEQSLVVFRQLCGTQTLPATLAEIELD